MPRLDAPADGVTVRMFRQGHGDCFLLAFPRPNSPKPCYVLIDCGMKPGSQNFLKHKKALRDVVLEDLHEACGGHLDLVILTHEHQDHLNGIWSKNDPPFEGFEIDEAWLAWTEDPDNELANRLRQRHKDQLLSLVAARRQLALAVGNNAGLQRLDQMLAFELGGDDVTPVEAVLAAASDPEKSVNKQGLKLVKDKAMKKRGCFYLSPGGEAIEIEGTHGVRAFILGPPEDKDLIADEDPVGDEGFPREHSFSFGEAARVHSGERLAPFRRHYCEPAADAFREPGSFFNTHYGVKADDDNTDGVETANGAAWRRIDTEWLYSAETLAIKLNTGINNTSLAIAFELPQSKKVLFFAADAQRGNWFSWKDVEFQDGTSTVDARNLLARAVLYKVGHHGSHNATLAGTVDNEYANLSWMAHGEHADEFVAMITAVTEWATTENTPPWIHPLPSIKTALRKKAQGRVLQTDEDKPAKPSGVPAAKWKQFTDRLVTEDLFFDLTIRDE
jgi:hypothetical protein